MLTSSEERLLGMPAFTTNTARDKYPLVAFNPFVFGGGNLTINLQYRGAGSNALNLSKEELATWDGIGNSRVVWLERTRPRTGLEHREESAGRHDSTVLRARHG